MIEVKDIRKSFDAVEVLKGFSVTFEKGKVSLIIGQSGSGKTVFFEKFDWINANFRSNFVRRR